MPSCDVQLEHLSVSRQHAQLTADGAGNLFITDLGSGEEVWSWGSLIAVGLYLNLGSAGNLFITGLGSGERLMRVCLHVGLLC